MTFPAPVSMAFDGRRAQFVADIGKRIELLDKSDVPFRNCVHARAELQRLVGQFHWATDEQDFLESRRRLITLIAQCYRTAIACQMLTENEAVAATDAVKR